MTATKYRKGACENCGAMSHKTKECMERPRKRGARWSGQGIQPDEVVQSIELGFDAKRDRWNGYDAEDHKQLIKEWELVEQERKKIKAKQVDQELVKSRSVWLACLVPARLCLLTLRVCVCVCVQRRQGKGQLAVCRARHQQRRRAGRRQVC